MQKNLIWKNITKFSAIFLTKKTKNNMPKDKN